MWIKHPRTKEPDTMLTLSVYAFVFAVSKFLLNGIQISILQTEINFGTTDATLIGAILVPTLGAYTARKFKNPPITEKEVK